MKFKDLQIGESFRWVTGLLSGYGECVRVSKMMFVVRESGLKVRTIGLNWDVERV